MLAAVDSVTLLLYFETEFLRVQIFLIKNWKRLLEFKPHQTASPYVE